MPTADSTRPQFGVLAVDGALEEVAARDAAGRLDGVVLGRAPRSTSMRMSLLAPSASWTQLQGQVGAHLADGCRQDAGRRCDAGGAARQQQHGVVGGHAAVGVDPVEGDARRGAQSRRRAAPPSATASVVRTTSIVARPGASMPAPLAIPPTAKPSAVSTACLATVSVVMIASPRRRRPRRDRAACAAVTPGSSRSIGRRSPISPVEQTATSPAPQPRRSATCSAVAWVSWKPSGPVQALAPPELRTTACTSPSPSTCCDHRTGAALNRLLVKTPAATAAGRR